MPFLIVFCTPRLKEHFCRDQFFLRNHLFNICYLITLLQRTNILKWQMIIVLSQWSELILKPGFPKGWEHVNWSSCLVLGFTSYCLRKQGGCCWPAKVLRTWKQSARKEMGCGKINVFTIWGGTPCPIALFLLLLIVLEIIFNLPSQDLWVFLFTLPSQTTVGLGDGI